MWYCIYLGISANDVDNYAAFFEQSRFVSFPTSDVQIDGDKRHRGVVLGILASSWTSGNRCGIGKKRHPLIMNCHKLASFLPSSACRGKLLSCILWWQVVEKGRKKSVFYSWPSLETPSPASQGKLFTKWIVGWLPRQEMKKHRAKISAHTTCISHIKCKTGPIEPFKNRYTMHPGVHFSPKCFENLNVCMKKMDIQPNRTAPNQNQRQKPKVCTQKHPEVLRVVQLLLPFNFLMLGATWNSVTKQTSWIYLTLQSNILFQHMPTCSHLCTMSIGTP